MSSITFGLKSGQPFIPNKLIHSFKFIWIPRSFLLDADLTSTEMLVWGALASRAGKNGKCYPSITTVAADVGRSRRGVQLALNSLEGKGFIKILKPSKVDIGKCKTNRYELLWHPALEGSLRVPDANTTATPNDGTPPSSGNPPAPTPSAIVSTPSAIDVKKPSEQYAPKKVSPNGEINTTTGGYSGGKNGSGCGCESAELSQDQEKYIDLKVEHMFVHGRITCTPQALRCGLENKARSGTLNLSDYEELKSWKKRQMGIRDCPPVKLPGTDAGEKAQLAERQKRALSWWNDLPGTAPAKQEPKAHELMSEAQWAVMQFGKYVESNPGGSK